MSKRIFTFWEPKAKIPAYLEFCLKSWQKFLSDYEIVILDYQNLGNWLSEGYFDNFLYKYFSLPVQTDAIRCAILRQYGGIWLDLDTIITSPSINKILSTDAPITLIGPHIAFINAKKDSKILYLWEEKIKTKISIAKEFNANFLNKIFHPRIKKSFKIWNYLGNSILDNLPGEDICRLNREELKAMPEYLYALENSSKRSMCKNYQEFYFKYNYSNYALENNEGIIMLHNSWTPEKYRKMTKQEFLNQKNTMSEIFKTIL